MSKWFNKLVWGSSLAHYIDEEFREINNKFKELEKKMKKKHPGFEKVQNSIAKEGYGKEAAGAILASATRNASKKAKKANPKLKKV